MELFKAVYDASVTMNGVYSNGSRAMFSNLAFNQTVDHKVKVTDLDSGLLAWMTGDDWSAGSLPKPVKKLSHARGKDMMYGFSSGRKLRVIGGLNAAQVELDRRLQLLTDCGIKNPTIALLVRVGTAPVIKHIASNKFPASTCTGTYFGSGHASESYITNGAVSDAQTRDNGFAVWNDVIVTLTEGQWLHRSWDASPGSSGSSLVVATAI